jgi:hypothetical protein
MPTHNLFYGPGSFIRQFQEAKILPPFFCDDGYFSFFEIFLYFSVKVLYNNTLFSIIMKNYFHILGGKDEMPEM